MHFTLVAISCLFCFSIFNVLVALLTFSTDSFVKRHPMATFIVELLLASIISGSLVAAVFAACSYTSEPFLLYWCTPEGHDNIFYTMMLPLQILNIAGMIMMILIIRRLRQVSNNTCISKSIVFLFHFCNYHICLFNFFICLFNFCFIFTIYICARTCTHIGVFSFSGN